MFATMKVKYKPPQTIGTAKSEENVEGSHVVQLGHKLVPEGSPIFGRVGDPVKDIEAVLQLVGGPAPRPLHLLAALAGNIYVVLHCSLL